MKKFLTAIMTVILSAQTVLAIQIVETTKLKDGSYIRKCKFDDGQIKYCTAKDEQKAKSITHKNSTVKKSAKPKVTKKSNNITQPTKTEQVDKKRLTAEKGTIPNSIAINKAIETTQQEIYKLYEKQEAGVDVSKELELANYKNVNLSQLNTVCTEFDKAYVALQQGIISQDEYNKVEAQIRNKDMALKTDYEKIMNMTYEMLQQEIEETNAKIQAEEKKQKKLEIGRRLLDQGTLYVPPSASNWIKQGADVLELLK